MRNSYLSIFLAVFVLFFTAHIGFAADFEKGLKAAQRGDFATALAEWKPLAEQGNAAAQYNLGLMYDQGWGVSQDYTEAVKWYRLAAEQGYALAQYNLGVMYLQGEGVPQHYNEAAKWYRLAAEQGYAPAQYTLGVMYDQGRGVLQNAMLAYMWYNISASNGSGEAVNNRDTIAKTMNNEDLSKAQALARECVKNNYRGC